MYLLGIDLGSSSVKVSLLNGESGVCLASAFYPKTEMPILSPYPGWAEQDPHEWMKNLDSAIQEIKLTHKKQLEEVGAIGISYQMHGLVAVDKNGKPVRDAIIWCDSRAVEVGERAFHNLGDEYCLSHLLNSPGNFTASKLAWVKQNEPEVFERIHKIMLPGDYIAYRLTGEITTTASGLSEGIFWDFQKETLSDRLLSGFGLDKDMLATVRPTFSNQGMISTKMAERLGINKNAVVSYRAGDQSNNAFSLNVLKPGDVATTAGTSGVIYGVTDRMEYDPLSRVNSFLHVNHHNQNPRIGILLCINGTGIMNSWLRREIMPDGFSYETMNKVAAEIEPGSEGLMVFPFGNGAERMLQNQNPGAVFAGLDLNRHNRKHLTRAAQEGIVFSMIYGLEIMQKMGMTPHVIRAGKANMFLSKLFGQTYANLSKAKIELYNTDGSVGAARGAGLGAGFYKNEADAFVGLTVLEEINPVQNQKLEAVYHSWKTKLETLLMQ
jgi:xylulokinase